MSKKPIKVRLVDPHGSLIVSATVLAESDGTMPRFLSFDGMVFMFDSGLQHCGERYQHIGEVTEVKSEMVTYRPPIKVTITSEPPPSKFPMPTGIENIYGEELHPDEKI